MFLGGKILKADGILAVHRADYQDINYTKNKERASEIQQSTQYAVSEAIGFLNGFNAPPFVFEKMFQSRGIYEFSSAEKKKLPVSRRYNFSPTCQS